MLLRSFMAIRYGPMRACGKPRTVRIGEQSFLHNALSEIYLNGQTCRAVTGWLSIGADKQAPANARARGGRNGFASSRCRLRRRAAQLRIGAWRVQQGARPAAA